MAPSYAKLTVPSTTQPRDFALDSDDDSLDGIEQSQQALDKESGLKIADEPPYSNGRRLSFIDQDRTTAQPELPKKAREGPVGWMELPHKRQLFILVLARLTEPLVQTGLQSYMFFQLQWFDKSLPESTISAQAGMLQGSFTAAQFLTAMVWGRISDAEWGGRKKVLLIGIFGTMLSCIGFGFSQTFWQAMIFRCLGGAVNGNVGVMRTMISEIIVEKRFQSRAFLLMPMCFNIGVIIGPIFGGFLADPAGSYPDIFGNSWFFNAFPYAPPNMFSALILFLSGFAVFFGLEETLPSIKHREDFGSKCARKIQEAFGRLFGRRELAGPAYTPIDGDEQAQGLLNSAHDRDVEMSPVTPVTPLTPFEGKPKKKKAIPRYREKLPFRRIFTRNVLCTFLAHFILAGHIGTFNNLWFIFLSADVADPANPNPPGFVQKLPFRFTGGIGMNSQQVGFAMAVLGVIGITLQLAVYPAVNARLGVVRSWRLFLYCFPIAYTLAPFLSVVPSRSPPPHVKDGFLLWLSLCTVLFIQVLGRTFALPATIILLNNCSPHPSVLGTIHGLGQSVSSFARTIGPIAGGWLFGVGLNHGLVGGVWWGLSCVALCACLASNFVRDGDGHEIRLPGDDEAEAEFQADQAVQAAQKAGT